MGNRNRIVTPPVTATALDVEPFVAWITGLLKTEAGVDEAQGVFASVAYRKPEMIDALVQSLGDATAPPSGVITVGAGVLVFGNPTREGWAWRCGTCWHAWKTGTGRPAAGVNYRTERGARNGADKHTIEHPNTTIKEVD